MRHLGIKRGGKTLGRGGKRRNRRLPHEHNVAGIKAARKRIGKVIRKGHQAVTGTHNTQQRQSRRHMRGRNKARFTCAGPYGPGLFKLLHIHATPLLK